MQDNFIVCVVGLKGFLEAIEASFPEIQLQLCIVHLVRHSLFYSPHTDRKKVAQDLKLIYQALTLEEADSQLSDFFRQMAECLSDGCPFVAVEFCARSVVEHFIVSRLDSVFGQLSDLMLIFNVEFLQHKVIMAAFDREGQDIKSTIQE